MRALITFAALAAACTAAPAGAVTCRLTPKAIVTKFMTQFYIEKDVTGAFARWVDPGYIQHNPMAASGLAGVKKYFIEVAKRKPTPTCTKLTSPVVAVQAEGDYVTVLAVRETKYADDPSMSYTTTWFDTWRFVGGKADEHWDPATLPTPAAK